MSVEIGKYSKKKDAFGVSCSVTIPKARKVGGRMYPYKSKYLSGEDHEDIQNDIRKELKIAGHVRLVPTSSRGGRIVVV
jgi:D-alanine-D-alanine ligase-like ATP-grasp enzyme